MAERQDLNFIFCSRDIGTSSDFVFARAGQRLSPTAMAGGLNTRRRSFLLTDVDSINER